MTTNELIKQIEGLQKYAEVMTLDDFTRTSLDRVINDMQDTLATMLHHGLFNIKEV